MQLILLRAFNEPNAKGMNYAPSDASPHPRTRLRPLTMLQRCLEGFSLEAIMPLISVTTRLKWDCNWAKSTLPVTPSIMRRGPRRLNTTTQTTTSYERPPYSEVFSRAVAICGIRPVDDHG